MTQENKAVAIPYPNLITKMALCFDLAICVYNQARWNAQERWGSTLVRSELRGYDVNKSAAKWAGRIYELLFFKLFVYPTTSIACPHINRDIRINPLDKFPEAKAKVFQAYNL